MNNIMAVLLNDIAQLEYDRDRPLSDYQETYLNSMDEKMDQQGIDIDGKRIENPDTNQKIQFVAANLLSAMKNDNEGLTSALCTYLATRIPDLKQIKYTDKDGDVTIDLVFDEDYKGQVQVKFGLH
jgi:hypothetical protein